MITLAPIHGSLLTSYGRGGRTLDATRQPWDTPYTVAQAGGASVWRASAGTVSAIAALNADMLEMGAAPLRLTEAAREQTKQQKARTAYLRWVRAGRPSRYDQKRMKNAYVAPANQSNHGWGGAIDIQVEALQFPNTGRGTDEALHAFWEVAEAHGFVPIIREANVDQAEAWHFDHPGGMRLVYETFQKAGERNPYGAMAETGCGLALTSAPSSEKWARWLQAYLVVAWAEGHGPGIGRVDGKIGRKTRAAVKAILGVDYSPADLQHYPTALVELGVGDKLAEHTL